MNTELLLQLIVNGVIVGTLYGVVAMCFVLIYKSTRVVNFAQGEFLLIGAWTCWWLLMKFELPFWFGFPLTLAFMVVFGIALQVIVLRPMIGEPIISVIMVTIGLSIFFQALMGLLFGHETKAYPQVFETSSINVLGMQVESAYILSMVISITIMIAFYFFFKYSKTGLAMRATGANARMARAQGVKTGWMILTGMALSNALVALAGSLFAQSQGSADVTMGVGVIVIGLASVIGGEALISPSTVLKAVLACIVGAILYRLAIAFALNLDVLGLKAQDLNLVTSILVMIAIVLPRYKFRRSRT